MSGGLFMKGLELRPAGLRALKPVPAVALTLVLSTAVVACGRLPLESPNGSVTGSGSGTGAGSGTGTGAGGGTGTTTGYSGPAALNADVLSFQTNLWTNISGSDRCGGCHKGGGQAPP